MELKITCKFIAKSEYKQITDNFGIQNFWVDIDGKYPTQAQFQINNHSIEVDFAKGTELEVSFNIQGRKWGKDDRSGFAQNLVVYRILNLSESQPDNKSTSTEESNDLPW